MRTVERLTEAAVEELTDVGYANLTVRNVAKRAGVAPATAYTYFASKEHLVTEVFWRLFRTEPEPTTDRRRSPAARAASALEGFALTVAHRTELAAACTVAVLADDPDVADLRERIGTELHRRLRLALGDDATPEAIEALRFATAGALLQVGTGHLAYADLPAVLRRLADTILEGTPS